MHTAAGLAKKFGLEQYLGQPGPLNEMIFSLMLLQETIQLEHARKSKRERPDAVGISVRRAAYGKFIAVSSGDEKYRYAVETALKASTEVISVFQRSRFVKLLRSMGVPDDKIDEFADTVILDDDTHSIDQE